MHLPTLTEEEAKAISPIVAVMKPYAGMLAAKMASGEPGAMAQELYGLIGPDLEDSVVALNEAGKRHGTGVFGYIGAGLVNQRASVVLNTLAGMILAGREGGAE